MRNRIKNLISVIIDPFYNYICRDNLFGLDDNQILHPTSTYIPCENKFNLLYANGRVVSFQQELYNLSKSMFNMWFIQLTY